jgi:hypothetical protein
MTAANADGKVDNHKADEGAKVVSNVSIEILRLKELLDVCGEDGKDDPNVKRIIQWIEKDIDKGVKSKHIDEQQKRLLTTQLKDAQSALLSPPAALP